MISVTLPFNFEPDIVCIRKEREKKLMQKEITDKQKKVLYYLKDHKNAHFQDIIDACDISLSGAKKIVSTLKEGGHLDRSGSLKNPYWIVKIPE